MKLPYSIALPKYDPFCDIMYKAFGVTKIYNTFEDIDEIIEDGWVPVYIGNRNSAEITRYKAFKFIDRPCLIFGAIDIPEEALQFKVPTEDNTSLTLNQETAIVTFKAYSELKNL